MSKRGSFALVLVGYNKGDLCDALDFINLLFYDFSVVSKVLVLNDPSLIKDVDVIKRMGEWVPILGTNELHEFSGWQDGIDYIASKYCIDFPIVFVNDTVNTHRYFSFFRKKAFLKSFASNSDSFLGFTSRMAKSNNFILDGVEMHLWVSTYMFCLSPNILFALDYKLYDIQEINLFVLGGDDESVFFSSLLSEELRSHLQKWLFGGGWYKSQKLTIDNSFFFEKKAKCILAEKLLSAKVNSNGFSVFDPFSKYPCYRYLDYVFRFIYGFFGKFK